MFFKCCLEDNISLAEVFLSRGADVDARDDDGWTPLHYAAELDRSEIVQLLLAVGHKFLYMSTTFS